MNRGAANENETPTPPSQPQGNYFWSWMYSTDGNANSWTFANQVNWNDFGCPGANGTQGSNCPGQPAPFGTSWTFVGLASDHSIAAVTDSSWGGPPSNANLWKSTVVGAALAISQSGTTQNPDAIVMLSLDGGATWGNGTNPPNPSVRSTMQWLDTNATDGKNDDIPFVFSNPESPYDTYASWQTRAAPVTGFLRKIKYDLSTTPYPTAQLGSFSIAIPRSNADNANNCGLLGNAACIPARFNFGFAQLPGSPCASGSEGIIVTWATLLDGSGVGCGNSRTGYGQGSSNPGSDVGLVSWNIAIYDTGCVNSGGTLGCWLSDNNSKCQQGNCSGCAAGHCAVAFTSSPHFDTCAGRNTQAGACGCSGSCTCPWYTNSEDPHSPSIPILPRARTSCGSRTRCRRG